MNRKFRRKPPQLSVGYNSPVGFKNTRVLRVGAEHRVGSGGGLGICHDKEKKDEKGTTRTGAVTPPVIVQGLPPRNQYWEVILKGEKGCETGNGVGIGFSLQR